MQLYCSIRAATRLPGIGGFPLGVWFGPSAALALLFGGLLFGLLFGCSAVLAAIDVALFVFPRIDTMHSRLPPNLARQSSVVSVEYWIDGIPRQ